MGPELLEGGIAFDDRGSVSFVNGFGFSDVKRFYQVENVNLNVVRAFHGHLHEGKYVYVVSGCAKVVCARMDGEALVDPQTFVLHSKKPSILKIPAGYANGFKALEEGTSVIFFSTSTLEESKGDDYRYEWDVLGKEIWTTVNR